MVYWLHTDHLGSVSLITDHASRVIAQRRFLPYGGERYSEGTFPTNVGFTGHRGQAGLGLVFMRARYYHPRLGRFVSADTVVPEPGNPQDLNRYAYVRNSPLKHVDPTGHRPNKVVPCPPPPGPYAEYDITDWPALAQSAYMLICALAPNCRIDNQLRPDYEGFVNPVAPTPKAFTTRIIWNDPEQWAQYQVASMSAFGADFVVAPELGLLRPPAKDLLPGEEILLTQTDGLQTRATGLFDDVVIGTPGDKATKYLWTIDDRGVNIALEQTPWPTPRGHIVHSNISSQAYVAGEAWFISPTEVVINADSGRWGIWTAEFTQAMWDAAVQI